MDESNRNKKCTCHLPIAGVGLSMGDPEHDKLREEWINEWKKHAPQEVKDKLASTARQQSEC
jgi:hypothetical protein